MAKRILVPLAPGDNADALIPLVRRQRWWHLLALGRLARRIARKATVPVMVLAC
jgi:nucleotide-binding universal stress UspA family protein